MVYLLTILLITVSFLLPKNKYVFLGIAIFLWILFGWSNNNADTATYLARYNQYQTYSSLTEPLFTFIVKIFNLIGFSYQQFLITVAFIYVSVLYFVVNRYSNQGAVVLALYLIFPFCIDIVQVRNTMAFTFILWGFQYLINKDKFSDIKYIICVALASSIHLSTIAYLGLLIAKRCSIKKTIIITTIITIILSLAGNLHDILINLASKFVGSDRAISILSRASRYNSYNIMISKMLIFFITFMIVLYFGKKISINKKNQECKVKRRNKKLIEFDRRELIDLVIKINILSLLLIPLIPFSIDLYRIQRYMAIFIYIACTQFFAVKFSFDKISIIFNKRQTKVLIIFIIIIIINLYLQLFLTNDKNTCFFPMFENNILIK